MKKLISILLIGIITVSLLGCTDTTTNEDNEQTAPLNTEEPAPQSTEPPDNTPSLAGIKLNDSKDKVLELLGNDYKETVYDDAEHFPEVFVKWEYSKGVTVILGKDSGKVFEVTAISDIAKTNLGVKVGDTAETVLKLYRSKYTEPQSIHGGDLPGVFKVENGNAFLLDFNKEDGIVNPNTIKDTDKLERIILTMPAYLDDDF